MQDKLFIFIIILLWIPLGMTGQDKTITDGLTIYTEAQSTLSSGKTPLWLNANKHGLSSLKEYNGYIRGAAIRPIEQDSNLVWGLGYGIDFVVPVNFSSKFIVQQAFVDGRWNKVSLIIGSKEYQAEFKNDTLSSGAQTLGINARTIPQIRFSLPEYLSVKKWFHIKGHIAYGIMTDGNWQEEFSKKKSNYSNPLFYHSKAGYIKIGSNQPSSHFNLELGLEMACVFGGTSFQYRNGELITLPGGRGWKAVWNALVPTGTDTGEDFYTNTAGDHIGSWLIRGNYISNDWGVSLYYDKFFEDHSGMFCIDYDGYGTGDSWNEKVDRRFKTYKLKDMLLGLEFNFNNVSWLKSVVLEYLYTKYQSGPIFHNHSATLPDHIGGRDNFYNHHVYSGWQHWGQVIGNPLYQSPIYNDDGKICVKDNRFIAYHFGATGHLTKHIDYRVLATYQKGWGTYYEPYIKPLQNFSIITEASYLLNRDWKITGAYAMDLGGIMGNNKGLQLTVRKSLRFE